MEPPPKICEFCHKLYFKRKIESEDYFVNLRRFCSRQCVVKFFKARRGLNPRDLEIVERIEKGETGDTIGKSLTPPLTRERIRQIYKRITGDPQKPVRRAHVMLKAFNKKKETRFWCIACGKPVDSLKGTDHLQKYCRKCHDIANDTNRRVDLSRNCLECGEVFHPHRAGWMPRSQKFCSQRCYHIYRNKHPLDYREKWKNKKNA